MKKLTSDQRDEILLEIYDATLVAMYYGTNDPDVFVKHRDIVVIINKNTEEDNMVTVEQTIPVRRVGKYLVTAYHEPQHPCPECGAEMDIDSIGHRFCWGPKCGKVE